MKESAENSHAPARHLVEESAPQPALPAPSAIERLDRWLNVIANLGVVAGLVFLAVQINQNTRATIAAASESVTNQSLEFFSMGIDNQVLARALYKQSIGEDLSDFEQHQVWWHQYFNFRVFESAYLQYRRGFYEQAEWERYRRIIRNRLTEDPFAKQMWEESSGKWTSEFSEEVNGLNR